MVLVSALSLNILALLLMLSTLENLLKQNTKIIKYLIYKFQKYVREYHQKFYTLLKHGKELKKVTCQLVTHWLNVSLKTLNCTKIKQQLKLLTPVQLSFDFLDIFFLKKKITC